MPEITTTAFRWTLDDHETGRYMPYALVELMRASPNRARTTGWVTTGFAHAIPTRIDVVCPDRAISHGACAGRAATALEVLRRIDGMCSLRRDAPKRPSSIHLTYYMWDEPKLLPERRGAECSSRHMNTGMCTRRISDGSCKIMIYRTEDAMKTTIHEFLHAFGVCDWCSEDPEIVRLVEEWSRPFNHGRVIRDLSPTECAVEALAVRIYGELYGVPEADVRATCRELALRLARHFRGHPWSQSTHAFEYVIMRYALTRRGALLAQACADGYQHVSRARMTRAFEIDPDVLEELKENLERVDGRSLRFSD
jgi:hypothetical protein